jgi:hypothetical protein
VIGIIRRGVFAGRLDQSRSTGPLRGWGAGGPGLAHQRRTQPSRNISPESVQIQRIPPDRHSFRAERNTLPRTQPRRRPSVLKYGAARGRGGGTTRKRKVADPKTSSKNNIFTRKNGQFGLCSGRSHIERLFLPHDKHSANHPAYPPMQPSPIISRAYSCCVPYERHHKRTFKLHYFRCQTRKIAILHRNGQAE